ncbi:MAG: hypothetical protein K8L99_11850 [Anaerolineae bacterium]|nr:hypothetical protein [Anaerolineae bacterium]
MDYGTELISLRTAADQREWTTLQDTLKRLLTGLEPIPALEIPALQVNNFLPRFETYYPDAQWVRELFMTVAAYASAPTDLPVQAVNQFPQPGCGNFVGAVLDLARAVQPKHTVYERYSFMTNATANALLSDLMDLYYGSRPEEWLKLTEEADETDKVTGLPVRQVQYMRFWLNDDVAARDTTAWLALADLLEARLEAR